jgi:hypothetical protein
MLNGALWQETPVFQYHVTYVDRLAGNKEDQRAFRGVTLGNTPHHAGASQDVRKRAIAFLYAWFLLVSPEIRS